MWVVVFFTSKMHSQTGDHFEAGSQTASPSMGFAPKKPTRGQSGLAHGNPLEPIQNPCEARVDFEWVIHGSIEG